ncbi:MAG: DNA-3-methyladenine glycosylase 2 family protein, partial [Firmicutes bacterium]|nr:DNA-3-methyladenine glycosylase 2 family protein [Bacillota bacterium]
CRNYGDCLPLLSSMEEMYAFPSVYSLARATESKLKECGLGYRVPYIISAARAVESGEIDLDAMAALPDDELLCELMKIYGVGIKVANCVSLFAYHRINACPIDVWIARVLEEKYNGCFDASRYEGFKGVIQQYMFYYIRNNH